LSLHYQQMQEEAVRALAKAKENHDIVEKMYIPHMNFDKINELAEKTVKNILA